MEALGLGMQRTCASMGREQCERLLRFVLLVVWLVAAPMVRAELVISEFVAVNVDGLADEDGSAEDWIEIHNAGKETVDLRGWTLTDDRRNKGKWEFPSQTLGAGEFIVVFASGKDRRVPGKPLHTNFKLEGAGEYLALARTNRSVTAVEFAPVYPAQRLDVSYGFVAGNWCYFESPTPGAPNTGKSLKGVAPEPKFSVQRGLYEQPLTLRLESDALGATIRYTVNGSEPTEAGVPYAGEIQITNNTVVRAVAFAEGYLPSRTITHSYLFLGQLLGQHSRPAGFPATWGNSRWFHDGRVPADYEMDLDPLRQNPNDPKSPVDAAKLRRFEEGMRELPVLSLVLKTEDMFGTGGLYPESREMPSKPSNEKACSVEMILPDGEAAFAVSCGIDLHGNASRNPGKNPKHGFKLAFKERFGETSLRYRLFPDSPADEFDDLILRPDFGVSWRHWSDSRDNPNGSYQRTRAARIRDPWFKDTLRDMGGIASYNRFCHLFINGLYWGIYDFTEQPTDSFARNYFGGRKEDFDIFDQGTLRAGTEKTFQLMQQLSNLGTGGNYELITRLLNVPEFVDYTLLHLFGGHQDWGYNKNWYAVRRRSTPTAKFRFIPWDGENVLMEVDVDRTRFGDSPVGLHEKLMRSAEYRLAFADRVFKHMIAPGGALGSEQNIALWRKWRDLLDKPIVAESVRWGDYRRDVHPFSDGEFVLYTRESHWLPEMDRIENVYFTKRNEVVLRQLRAAGLYPAVDPPAFNQDGGRIVAPFQVAMTARKGKIYYTTNGTDPRQSGTSAPAADAKLYSRPIQLLDDTYIRARVVDGGTWSAINEATFTTRPLGVPLRITQIMYNPPADAPEYIQLMNLGPAPLDVSQFRVQGIDFIFSDAILQPGEKVYLTSTEKLPSMNPVLAVFGGSLNNGGERLTILDRRGRAVVSVEYDDENGWAKEADGSGSYLEMIDPFGNADDVKNWRASSGSASKQ